MIEILRVTGAFGIGGAVRVLSFSQNLSIYKKVYNKNGEGFSFRVMKFLANSRVVISIKSIDTRNQAESMKGQFFYVKKTDLPSKNNGEFYPNDLIGRKVQVISTNIKCLIAGVENFGAGDLIEISHKNDKFLVPFTRENFPDSGDEIFITAEAFNGFKN